MASPIAAFGFVLLAATPLAAQTAPAPKDKPTADDPNRMKCVVEQGTGSRLDRRRICMTVAQWEEERQRQRQDIEASQRIRTPGAQ